MNKQQAVEIGDAVKVALSEVAERFNMTVEMKGGRYDIDAGTFTPKVEFKSADSERVKFERDAYAVAVSPDLFGKTFEHQGKKFTVSGLNLRAPKYPLQARDEQGRTFKFSNTILERVNQGATRVELKG